MREPAGKSMQFSQVERELAIRAMDDAEERTIRYYCIPPYRWQQLHYDLVTRQDSEWEPLPDCALAGIRHLHRVHPSRKSAFDFYRIQLNDSSILNAAHRENLCADLYPFLTYILTHEMVHLVRLSTILPHEEESRLSAEDEEDRVRTVAHRILSVAPDRRLYPVLSRFGASDATSLSAVGPAWQGTGSCATSHQSRR